MAGHVLLVGGHYRGPVEEERVSTDISKLDYVLQRLHQLGLQLTLPNNLKNLRQARMIYEQLSAMKPNDEETLRYVTKLVGYSASWRTYRDLVSGLRCLLHWRQTLEKAKAKKSPGLNVRLPDGTLKTTKRPHPAPPTMAEEWEAIRKHVREKKRPPPHQPERVLYFDPNVSERLVSGSLPCYSFEMGGQHFRLPREVILQFWRDKADHKGWHWLSIYHGFLVSGSLAIPVERYQCSA